MDTSENEVLQLATRFINRTHCNVFLTGKAGTGKTTFLREIVKQTHKRAVIAAPTGIAAINAGGVTLHSLLQLPFGSFIPENNGLPYVHPGMKITDPQSLIKNLQMREPRRNLIRNTELLIIDEVSMLRADLLDAIDTLLRYLRRKQNLPFGGMQMLFIGDLQQLPPVVKEDEWQILKAYYSDMWFFNARVLKSNQPHYLELENVYRQHEQRFIYLLNNLRNNTVTPDDLSVLQSRYNPHFEPPANEDYITLTTHNAKADNINLSRLSRLGGKVFSYKAVITGDFNEYSYPVEPELQLKTGAQVMFIKNDPSGQRQFFNGRLGVVTTLDEEEIRVGFADGSPEVTVERYEWQNVRYSLNSDNEIEENVLGTFSQYPLKLAWAVTIHKSQGLTFDKAVVDIGNAFAPGQIYVALSRLRSLDGLVMRSPLNTALLGVDTSVINYASHKAEPSALQKIAEKESATYLKDQVIKAYGFSKLHSVFRRHVERYDKDEALSARQKYQFAAMELQKEVLELKKVSEKFIPQLDSIFRHPLSTVAPVLKSRLQAANDYFLPLLRQLSAGLFDLMNTVKSREKKAKSFLEELFQLETNVHEHRKQMQKALLLACTTEEKREITSAELERIRHDSWRENRLTELQLMQFTGAPKKTTPKAKKGSSRKHSLELFRQGQSVEDIAMLRSLTPGTIESHLLYYVKRGQLDAVAVIGEEKLSNIRKVMEKVRTNSVSAIMKYLGEEYTWSDVRIAMADSFGEETDVAE